LQNNNLKNKDMYPEEMKPMRAELSDAGFQDLHNAEDVKNAIQAEGTTLVVVNCFRKLQEMHVRGAK
jgi:hypothetical protein